MKPTNHSTDQQALPSSKRKFTCGTGNKMSPADLKLVSTEKSYWYITNRFKRQTLALQEWWQLWTDTTRQELRQQNDMVENTFPFIRVALTFDAEAIDVKDRPLKSWGKPSGFAVLTFRYTIAKNDAIGTAARRDKLQRQLLAEPLLGPSIVLITKCPGRCIINVIIAIGHIPNYRRRVNIILDYLRATKPRLYKNANAHTDRSEWGRCYIGYDPAVFFKPAPENGYPIFPIEPALSLTDHIESLRSPKTVRKTR